MHPSLWWWFEYIRSSGITEALDEGRKSRNTLLFFLLPNRKKYTDNNMMLYRVQFEDQIEFFASKLAFSADICPKPIKIHLPPQLEPDPVSNQKTYDFTTFFFFFTFGIFPSFSLLGFFFFCLTESSSEKKRSRGESGILSRSSSSSSSACKHKHTQTGSR